MHASCPRVEVLGCAVKRIMQPSNFVLATAAVMTTQIAVRMERVFDVEQHDDGSTDEHELVLPG